MNRDENGPPIEADKILDAIDKAAEASGMREFTLFGSAALTVHLKAHPEDQPIEMKRTLDVDLASQMQGRGPEINQIEMTAAKAIKIPGIRKEVQSVVRNR